MQFDTKIILKEFIDLPKFEDGRIDYTSSKKAPILLCFVKFQEKILLVKRSNKVGNYQGKWNVVAGFIDEPKPLKEKVLEELTAIKKKQATHESSSSPTSSRNI